ncbi:hypothetical protein [Engelhardtia mirabilis]
MMPKATTVSLLVAGFVGGLCANSIVGAAPTQGGGTVSVPYQMPAYATGDSNGAMIAVTGVDLTGSSVLYLVDTESKQLACYQATGGSSSTQGLKLIGARRIDLDLQLHGFRDKSEYSYRDLEKQFAGLEEGE